MKIYIDRISAEGITLNEELDPSGLDLNTYIIKLKGPIKVRADISKITNTVMADIAIDALLFANCSRCLEEFKVDYKKDFKLVYAINNSESIIDLSSNLRDEIILDYPLRPLCKPDCKGLCPKCGKNINEGKCNC